MLLPARIFTGQYQGSHPPVTCNRSVLGMPEWAALSMMLKTSCLRVYSTPYIVPQQQVGVIAQPCQGLSSPHMTVKGSAHRKGLNRRAIEQQGTYSGTCWCTRPLGLKSQHCLLIPAIQHNYAPECGTTKPKALADCWHCAYGLSVHRGAITPRGKHRGFPGTPGSNNPCGTSKVYCWMRLVQNRIDN